MWKSYHIYNVDYLNFIDEVSILKKNYFDYQSSFFFTVYADFKGIHYRLRIKEEFIESEISNSLQKELDEIDYLFGHL